MSRVSTPTKVSTPPKWKLRLRSLYKLRSSLLLLMLLLALPLPEKTAPSTPECDFLTPLDVYQDEYFTPLTDQKDITLGELTLPPPPPPQRHKWGVLEPESPLFEHSRKPSSPGPRVKPYFATTTKRPNIAGNVDICFICDELLETTLYLEKLVPLLCGDRVHEECLRTVVNHELEKKLHHRRISRASSTAELMHAVFPNCHGTICRTKDERPLAVPLNTAFLDDLNNDLRLSLKLTRFEASRTLDPAQEEYGTAVLSPIFSDNYTMDFFPEKNKQVPRVPLRIDTGASNAYNRESSAYNRESGTYNTNRASLASNISIGTTATASVRVSIHNLIPPEELKLAFIQHMINHAPGFDLSMLVSLGKLRLVDLLFVSTDRASAFELANVYLFTNYLVIWSANHPPQFLMVPLNETTSINTPIPSVLQLSSSSGQDSFNVRLHSETGSIIEKWGIAISDSLMTFPPNIFSSTLRLPDIVAGTSFPGITTPQKQKPKVSPIMESSSEFAPTVPERSPERGILNFGGLQVYSDDATTPAISRPTSPLRLQLKASSDESTKVSSQTDITKELVDDPVETAIEKLSGTADIKLVQEEDSDDDSDEDLDCELIDRVMKSL